MFGLSTEELESLEDDNPLQAAPDQRSSGPFETTYLNFCKQLAGVDEFARVSAGTPLVIIRRLFYDSY